jgi:hypothetical protein
VRSPIQVDEERLIKAVLNPLSRCYGAGMSVLDQVWKVPLVHFVLHVGRPIGQVGWNRVEAQRIVQAVSDHPRSKFVSFHLHRLPHCCQAER